MADQDPAVKQLKIMVKGLSGEEESRAINSHRGQGEKIQMLP